MSNRTNISELIGVATKKLQKTGMTNAGQKWLINSLDPFHDTDVKCDGLPDGHCAQTVNVTIKGQTTVSAPSWVGADGAWDLQNVQFNEDIGNYSTMGGINSYMACCDVDGPYISMDTIVGTADEWQGAIGPCAYCISATGYPGFPDQPLASLIPDWDAGDAVAPHTWGLVPDGVSQSFEYTNHPFRVIGRGLECTMVGPELTKSGTVTVGRVTGYTDTEHIFVSNAVNRDNITPYDREYLLCKSSPLPPVSPDIIRNLPGARTWAARQGVYTVSTMVDPSECTISGHQYCSRLFKAEDEHQGTDDDTHGIGRFPLGGSLSFQDTREVPPKLSKMKAHPNAFNPSVVTFSGLHADDKITITTRELIEMLPNPADVLFQQLANKSPRMDPIALALYRIIAPAIPSGVPVSMNAKGDYWNVVMKLIDAAVPIVKGIPNIGPVISGGLEIARLIAPRVRKAVLQRNKGRYPAARPRNKPARISFSKS